LPRQIRNDAVIAKRYRIERVLGAGGMGVVAAAEDVKTGTPVAIKFLIHHAAGEYDGLLERFVREAQALLRVQSEHVVRVLDVGNLANGAPFIVMERLEGEDLNAALHSRGPLSPEEVVDALAQACIAVAAAHACGIIHRDLKPANLFMTRQPNGAGVLKVLDFGVSKLGEEGAPELTQASTMVGSAYYMSPEQMNGMRELDGRSDIWSLGVTAYELLTGKLPFDGSSIAEVCAQVLYEPPKSPLLLRPDLPPALCDVVLRCLSKDREQRHANADELAEALLGSLPAQATTSPFTRRSAR
ncbi:MAG TPA: serine/threonine-protein kinase, partial [Nannocystis sp.]